MKQGLYIFPGDWTSSAVAACSLAAQGLWFRLLLIMSSNEQGYGTLKAPNGAQMATNVLARRVGCTPNQFETLMAELQELGVVDVDDGVICCRWMRDRRRELDAKAARQRRYQVRRSDGASDDASDDAPDDGHLTRHADAPSSINSDQITSAAAAAGIANGGSRRAAASEVRQRLLAAGISDPTASQLEAEGATVADVAAAVAKRREGKGVGVVVNELRAAMERRRADEERAARHQRNAKALSALDEARQREVLDEALRRAGCSHLAMPVALKSLKVRDAICDILEDDDA